MEQCPKCRLPITDESVVMAQQACCQCGGVAPRRICKSYKVGCDDDCDQPGEGECPHPDRNQVCILEQHAASFATLVRWFKAMITEIGIPESPDRSDLLTVGYCDELLEDLEQ